MQASAQTDAIPAASRSLLSCNFTSPLHSTRQLVRSFVNRAGCWKHTESVKVTECLEDLCAQSASALSLRCAVGGGRINI